MTLAEKLRKARQIKVEAGDFIFTILRPTDLDMLLIRKSGSSSALLPFVIDWSKKDGSLPSEIDLGLSGGEPHPLKFDADACAEFLSDRSDLFQIVMEKMVDAYTEHVKSLGEAKKV